MSLSDFRTEFVGGCHLTATSGAAATSGRRLTTQRRTSTCRQAEPSTSLTSLQAKGFRKTYSSGATNQDASSIRDDYGVDYPKEIVIIPVSNQAQPALQEALQIDSGLSGSMTITNNGTLTGAGGAANGGRWRCFRG